MIYHVAPSEHTGNLESLHVQHGDDAYTMYAERWPESGNLCDYHAHYIHCYDSLEQAQEHAEQWDGKIYAIDDSELEVERDTLEFDHPMVRDEIDAQYLQEIL